MQVNCSLSRIEFILVLCYGARMIFHMTQCIKYLPFYQYSSETDLFIGNTMRQLFYLKEAELHYTPKITIAIFNIIINLEIDIKYLY